MRVRARDPKPETYFVGAPAHQHGVETLVRCGDAERAAEMPGNGLREASRQILQVLAVRAREVERGVGACDEPVEATRDVVAQFAHQWLNAESEAGFPHADAQLSAFRLKAEATRLRAANTLSPYLDSPAGEFLGAFSPDGRFVRYMSDEADPTETWVAGFPGPDREAPDRDRCSPGELARGWQRDSRLGEQRRPLRRSRHEW